jgi:hypothetical protein
MRAGQEREVQTGKGKNRQLLKCSRRWLPLADPNDQINLCIHKSSLEWIKRELGMESADAKGKTYRGSSRPWDSAGPTP